MKILTLKQPWASLVANGYKTYEFRSWKTSYRGDILIHAGLSTDIDALKRVQHYNLNYPSKQIIAIAHLDDCIQLTPELNKEICNSNPYVYGNKERTGYVWKLSNIRKIDNGDIVPGKLGLWNYDTDKYSL